MSLVSKFTSAFTILLTTTLAAFSFPTVYGDTGLIMTPTAETVGAYNFDLACSYTQVNAAPNAAAILPARLTYGISPNTEIGIFLSESSNNQGNGFDIKGGSLKLIYSKENVLAMQPGLAFGVRVAKQSTDRPDITEAYSVVTKTVFARGDMDSQGYAFRAHAGAAVTTYSGAQGKTFLGPFAAMDYINTSGNTLMVEFLPEQKSSGVFYRRSTISAAIRRPLSDSFEVELGTTRLFGDVASDMAFYGGLNYHYTSNGAQW